jgi:hypothetical protein
MYRMVVPQLRPPVYSTANLHFYTNGVVGIEVVDDVLLVKGMLPLERRQQL